MLKRVPKIPWGVALKLEETQETCPLRMVCLDTQETEWTYQETGQAKKELVLVQGLDAYRAWVVLHLDGCDK